MKRQILVSAAVLVLLLAFAGGAVQYNAKKNAELGHAAFENAAFLLRDYSPTKGNTDAQVTIVEFFDPACETCRAFYPFVEQLMKANPGRVGLVLRYTPFHDGSNYVVKMLEAAGKQGRYWEALEVLFASQPAWTEQHSARPERLRPYLDQAGLDIEKAKRDMHDSNITDRIRQDMSDARQLNVTKTPGYFVNGRPLV